MSQIMLTYSHVHTIKEPKTQPLFIVRLHIQTKKNVPANRTLYQLQHICWLKHSILNAINADKKN